jgi:hypothetical protein
MNPTARGMLTCTVLAALIAAGVSHLLRPTMKADPAPAPSGSGSVVVNVYPSPCPPCNPPTPVPPTPPVPPQPPGPVPPVNPPVPPVVNPPNPGPPPSPQGYAGPIAAYYVRPLPFPPTDPLYLPPADASLTWAVVPASDWQIDTLGLRAALAGSAVPVVLWLDAQRNVLGRTVLPTPETVAADLKRIRGN